MLGREAVDNTSVPWFLGKEPDPGKWKAFVKLVIPAGQLDKTKITHSQNCGV